MPEKNKNLKFSNGTFKILIFADLQDQFPVHEQISVITKKAIERECPDLIVLLGDQTEMNTKDPEVDFRRTLQKILTSVAESKIPYAFVFGNHDDQCYYKGFRADKKALLKVYQTIGDCRTYDDDISVTGTGNCKIPIYSSNGNSIVFNLFFIDSNTYIDPIYDAGGYDAPHTDQLIWLMKNADNGVNSFVFQHIPMPEIYNLLIEDKNGPKLYGEKKYSLKLNSNANGYLGEFPCPPDAENNRGEFSFLKEIDRVLAVFSGHDHLNDFVGTYDGIDMISVPGITYFNYGDDLVRGYGVIELNENNTSSYNYKTVKICDLLKGD